MKEQKKYSWSNMIHQPIVKIIIGTLFCILIPILINKLVLDNVFHILGINDNLNRGVRVFITTIILMPSLYYFLFAKLENRRVTELQFKNMSVPIIIGFVSSIAVIGLSFFSLVLMGYITIQEVYSPESVIINIIIILGFVIIEEIFFRGIFYRIIENTWGTIIALVSSALLFSILHLANENASIMSFASVAAGGAILGILYTYTKNLLVPIAFHFGWNLTQVLLGFGLSGGNEFSALYLLKFSLSGSAFLTGGYSGIENSIIPILCLIILFTVLLRKSYHSNTIVKLKKNKKMNMKTTKCESCGMPLKNTNGFVCKNSVKRYCNYCIDKNGNLKSFDAKVADFKILLMKSNRYGEKEAIKMAKEKLKQFPAWENTEI